MLMASARMIVLKKNDTTPWITTMRRIRVEADVDVRGGEGAADDEGLIDELGPSRLRLSRKFEAAANVARMRLIVDAGIVEREHGLDESPGA